MQLLAITITTRDVRDKCLKQLTRNMQSKSPSINKGMKCQKRFFRRSNSVLTKCAYLRIKSGLRLNANYLSHAQLNAER